MADEQPTEGQEPSLAEALRAHRAERDGGDETPPEPSPGQAPPSSGTETAPASTPPWSGELRRRTGLVDDPVPARDGERAPHSPHQARTGEDGRDRTRSSRTRRFQARGRDPPSRQPPQHRGGSQRPARQRHQLPARQGQEGVGVKRGRAPEAARPGAHRSRRRLRQRRTSGRRRRRRGLHLDAASSRRPLLTPSPLAPEEGAPMPYNSLIQRSDVAARIPAQVSNIMLNSLYASSAALAMGTRIPLPAGVTTFPVLSALPQAYWVNGDTGLKQTTTMAWAQKTITVEEVAAIVPIPDNVFDDADFDVWSAVRPALETAIARVIDGTIFLNINKPTSFPVGLAAGALAMTGNANSVVRGTAPSTTAAWLRTSRTSSPSSKPRATTPTRASPTRTCGATSATWASSPRSFSTAATSPPPTGSAPASSTPSRSPDSGTTPSPSPRPSSATSPRWSSASARTSAGS